MKQIRIHQTCAASNDGCRTQFRQPEASVRRRRRIQPGRRGSTFLIVIALTGLLALVGFMFVTFSGQEQTAAENFASGSKRETDPHCSPEVLFNHGLRQLIVGTNNEDVNGNHVLDPGEDLNANGVLDNEPNSALWGGRKSLLATLVGGDIHPFSGQGVNVIVDAAGQPVVDQDYDQTADNTLFLNLADSPSANRGEDLNNNGVLDFGEDLNGDGNPLPDRGADFIFHSYPHPDVDNTCPDINNPFLAYKGYALDPSNKPIFVVMPSFYRPQILRELSGGQTYPIVDSDFPVPFNPTVPHTSQKLLRPHPFHVDVAPNGAARGTRFVLPDPIASALSLPTASDLGLSGPFPFGNSEDLNDNDVLDAGEDTNGNGLLDTEAHHGVWTLGERQKSTYYRKGQWIFVPSYGYFVCTDAGVSSSANTTDVSLTWGTPPVTDGGVIWNTSGGSFPQYAFDADPDGDGIKEAVWLDLDFPVQQRGDGKYYIPLFAFTVYDADGLINLNTAGNVHGPIAFDGNPFGLGTGQDGQPGRAGFDDDGDTTVDNASELGWPGTDDTAISLSNQGVSGSEVNPTWVLTARPPGQPLNDFPPDRRVADVFEQHSSFFPLEDLNYNRVLDPGEDTNSNGRLDGRIPMNWKEAASMEWWFAVNGRPQFQHGSVAISVLDFFAGRSGDLSRLFTGTTSMSLSAFPFPGVATSDDNGNQQLGLAVASDPHAFGHPLDFRGAGVGAVLGEDLNGNMTLDPGEDVNGNGVLDSDLWVPLLVKPGTPPDKWLGYFRYGVAGPSVPQQVRWANALGGSLMGQTRFNSLVDEPDETIRDARFSQGTDDDAFPPSENFALQASNSDIEKTGAVSRLTTLMEYNLKTNVRAAEIRRQFTTTNWDPKAFGTSWFPGTGIGSLRPWEFTSVTEDEAFPPGHPFRANSILNSEDNNSNGVLDPGEDTNGNGALDTEDLNGNLLLDPPTTQFGLFPPRLATWLPLVDPVRPELRQLLNVIGGKTSGSSVLSSQLQRRLSLNQVLVYQDETPGNPLTFRSLTPHPGAALVAPVFGGAPASVVKWKEDNFGLVNEDTNQNGVLDGGEDLDSDSVLDTGKPDYSLVTTDVKAQEWWARHDRQRMARDIYVLLYVFGGGDDSVDYTQNNARLGIGIRPLYTDAQLREMAQFAVNLVDTLDRDTVLSKFEYDKDLSDGWNLNDDAFSWDGGGYAPWSAEQPPLAAGSPIHDRSFPEDGPDRGVVYGNEAQQLTFNEALTTLAKRVVNGGGSPVDHPGTEYDDRKDRYFTYVELRNATPQPVDFNNGTFALNSVRSGLWQIEAIVTEDSNGNGTLELVEDTNGNSVLDTIARRVTLRDGTIAAGGRFTIGTTGDIDTVIDPMTFNRRPSFFRVDTVSDGITPPANWNTISPIAPKANSLDLDLIPTTGADLSNVDAFRLCEGPTASPLLELFGDGQRVNRIGELVKGGVVGSEDANGNGAPDPGEDVNANGSLDTMPLELTFVLRRRVHPDRQPPVEHDDSGSNTTAHLQESRDNPWVEVDRIGVQLNFAGSSPDLAAAALDHDLALGTTPNSAIPVHKFELMDGDVGTTFPLKLVALKSIERRQPLSRGADQGQVVGGDDKANSLGQENITTNNLFASSGFTRWELHFDRDLASPVEMLAVPLYGPRVGNRMLEMNGINSAGVQKFLHPEFNEDIFPAGTFVWEDRNGNNTIDPGSSISSHQLANRWYRLFGFVEVPSRADLHAMIPQNMKYRTAGMVNLNTIPTENVLAALLDDERSIDLDMNDNDGSYLNDTALEPGTRDWWREFLRARDGVDPVTNFVLPGMPTAPSGTTPSQVRVGSQPFRSPEFVAASASSIEQTLLRALPLDANSRGRRLFELGNMSQHQNGTVDYVTRQRLLSKIWNNTTTRSNVFFVFIQVDFFEAAVDQTNGHVQIGAKLHDVQPHRGFFVIDRSLALEQLHPASFIPGSFSFKTNVPNEDANGNGILDGGEDQNSNGVLDIPFDYNRLILHRQIIE